MIRFHAFNFITNRVLRNPAPTNIFITMKKLLFVIVSALTVVGFTSCEQAVTEKSIVGRWDLVYYQCGDFVLTNVYEDTNIGVVDEVWVFHSDHRFYSYCESPDITIAHFDSNSTWLLEGNKLTIGNNVYTTSMNSNTLVLTQKVERDNLEEIIKFKKIK